MKRAAFEFELRRKLLHSFFGLILISILFYSGRKNLITLLSLLLLLGSIMVVWRIQGRKIPVADWFEETFERENVEIPRLWSLLVCCRSAAGRSISRQLQ